jgi:hypothetical protein
MIPWLVTKYTQQCNHGMKQGAHSFIFTGLQPRLNLYAMFSIKATTDKHAHCNCTMWGAYQAQADM